MKTSRIIGGLLLASITAFAIAAAPLPASAGPKAQGHKGHGHNSHGRDYAGQNHAGQKFCPPGLAKKGCIPPGQRKKWTKGRALPHDVYYRPVPNWREYDLSPPPYGHVYGSVDGDILLIRAATRLVVDVAILAALLD